MSDTLAQNRASWDAMADSWFGSTALPTYGVLCPTEDELRLMPDLHGKRVLELGCGSGHSLKWCAEHGAAELWGVDLSARQIENARRQLAERDISACLINAPMEAPGDLPRDYFDVVYSIYAIGWTTSLTDTLRQVSHSLKMGGVLIFSWDHPLMRCVDAADDRLVFTGQYVRDESFSYVQRGQPVTVQHRRMSTYINALADAGFAVERLIEETDAETFSRPAAFSAAYFAPYKATRLPLSFIIKARKIR